MKNILVLLAVISLSMSSFAQSANRVEKRENIREKREHIEAQKVAFITEQMGLTPEESGKFWAVHNNYQKELDALRGENSSRKEMRATLVKEEISEKELDNVILGQISNKEKEAGIERKYYSEFKKVLSIQKVAAYYIAEKQFKRELLKSLREGKPAEGRR